MKFKTFIVTFIISLGLGAIGYALDQKLFHHTNFPILAAVFFLIPSMYIVFYSKTNGGGKK